MKKKLLFIILGIIVVIAIAVVLSGKKDSTSAQQSASPLVSTETGQSAALPANASAQAQQSDDLVALLRSVTTLTINPVIFSNPVYKALGTDTLILPEPITRGRVNPFAAIGTTTPATPVGGAAAVTTP
jgi:hypothetical protein